MPFRSVAESASDPTPDMARQLHRFETWFETALHPRTRPHRHQRHRHAGDPARPVPQPGRTLGPLPRRERFHARAGIEYFGDPVYTYSLRQGISDGFLAPYKVVRIGIDKDNLDGWRPEIGQTDKYGNTHRRPRVQRQRLRPPSDSGKAHHASSLSSLQREVRGAAGRMDAGRGAQAMILPLPRKSGFRMRVVGRIPLQGMSITRMMYRAMIGLNNAGTSNEHSRTSAGG